MGRDSPISRQLRTLFREGTLAGLTDGQLLERFLDVDDREAGEAAFGLLVARHGAMVLGVCRLALGDDPHSADDAFQATFLVLIRRAASIRSRDSVASWLHGVALRVSAGARSDLVRRRKHERRGAGLTPGESVADRRDLDSGPAIHEELARLPEKFRAPLVLCHLEGLTHDEAADRLRWPVGTVRSRLARARQRLKGRLIRRGLAPSAVLASSGLVEGAGIPAVSSTMIEAATRVAAGKATGRAAMAGVAALVERELKMVFLAQIKAIGVGMMAVGVVATGLFAATRGMAPTQAPAPKGDVPPPPPVVAQAPAPPKPVVPLPRRVLDGDWPVRLDSGKWNFPLQPPKDPNLVFSVLDLADLNDGLKTFLYTSARLAKLPDDTPSDKIVAKLPRGDLYSPELGVIQPLRGVRIAPLDLPPIPKDANVVERTIALETAAVKLTTRQVAEQVLANPRGLEKLRLEEDGRYAVLRPDGKLLLMRSYHVGDSWTCLFIMIDRVTLADEDPKPEPPARPATKP